MKVADRLYRIYRGEAIDFFVIEKVMPKTIIASGDKFRIVDGRFYLIGRDDYNMYQYVLESPDVLKSYKRHEALSFINGKNISYLDTDTVLQIAELIKLGNPHKSKL